MATETRWLAKAIEGLGYSGEQIISLQDAAYRLYPLQPPQRMDNYGAYWPSWRSMRVVYERSKGQPFVLEPSPEVLKTAGFDDVGPLYLWRALWRFAGCPQLRKNGVVKERPSWKPAIPIPTRRQDPDVWVTRLREYEATRPKIKRAIGRAPKGTPLSESLGVLRESLAELAGAVGALVGPSAPPVPKRPALRLVKGGAR